MLKMLPDAAQRLSRRLSGGPIDQRLKAMQITQELGLGELVKPALVTMCGDPNAKLRSKAVSILGELDSVPPELLMDRLINDSDARVRANAIEVLETRQKTDYLPMLAQRARSAHNRERANAIKALHKMKVKNASGALLLMLKDNRAEHRISALWALKAIGWWQLLNEVGRLAKQDDNLRVRRYALGVLKNVAEMMQTAKAG
jgi:HEAT repeat protein